MVDVDGVVCISPDGRNWAADLGLSPETLQHAFFAPHFGDVIRGRAGLHERLAPVLEQVAPHLTAEALIAYWFEKDAHLDHTLLDDLAALRAAGVELHLATIQEHLRADYLWTKLALRDRFDAMHYAADLGCLKPEPEFFAAITARTGFAPGELVLIDDKSANVEGARAAGWGGALWDGTGRLAEVLARAGVRLP